MYDFKKTEAEILEFWHKNRIFDKSLALNKNGKRFVFFEGPPTANGRPGIHHFLGRAFKDIFNRYKTMRGFYVLRKAGWDTHGLPVEIEIEKELGFKNKKDIENYGIDKFNKKAKESVWKYKMEWEDMTRRMGFWVDLNHPYITYENNYIESLWNIIQTIWDRKLLYLAHKVVPFCVRCGTPLSSHEVAQGYKKVKDKSVYIKFKLLPGQKFGINDDITRGSAYIVAWTTTPWTLPGNVALAINKDISYSAVLVDDIDDLLIVATDLVEKVFAGHQVKTLSTFKGDKISGLKYEPLFDIKELKSETAYKIYEADFVSTEDGTGVVHTAVMYGEDDYNLGTRLGLPKFHTVDEAGRFVNVGEDFDGMIVKHKDNPTEDKTTQKIISYLKKRGNLYKEEEYEHDYPFCWRCDSPLLYYAKESWFIKMSAVKDQLLKNNSLVNWFPEHIKEGRFGQWIKEGKDWAFSRERYWGTPLPIWKCQKCEHYKVVGSVAEMEKNTVAAASKKNTYYLLRHSYTTRDEAGKMIIGSDLKSDKYHLTERGKKQIQKVAELIKNNHKIDLIYTSPFIRTMETAEIVAKLVHVKVEKDDRLVEIRHGGCEGKPHNACPVDGMKQTIDSKHHEPGESWNDVRRRMVSFINDIETKYSGKHILITGHGDPLWLLNCIAEGATGDEVVGDNRDGRFPYPKLAGFNKLNWRSIPRNEDGELELHRPLIDSVYLKCEQCGASMKKVPDLIDVWFDSGAMPYAQWHWPFENKKLFEDQFPADFIAEGIDQTRGWFYTLLAISTLLGKSNPYKNVISLGHVLDDKGKKMSKSKGNVISPFEVMDKVGSDAARWYFYTINTPGEYKNFSMKDVEGKLKSFIFILENCVRFYELYSSEIQDSGFRIQDSNLLDKWILSRFNVLVAEASSKMDSYDPTTAARLIEKFLVEDLSQWWLRRSRKRKDALGILRFLLLELSKVIAPFTPFIAEDVHRRMHKGQKMGTESVHLHEWPSVNKKLINKKLEEEMEGVRNIVTSGLAVRKEKQIKVRQPLRSVTIGRSAKFHADLEELIRDELNVKDVIYDKKQNIVATLDVNLDPALINEGYARELIRQIQDMRKEAGYRLDDRIQGQWHSDDEDLSLAVREWSGEIKKEALFKEFINSPQGKKKFDVGKEFDIAPQLKIWIGVRK